MRKILGLTVAALLVMGLVGGGTWAYFSDTESSTGNTLSAGTLDLNINGANSAVTMFTVSNLYPGDSDSAYATLSNAGNLAGELDITLSSITNTESTGSTEYEQDSVNGSSGELGAYLEIAIYIDVNENDSYDDGSDIGLDSDGNIYTSGSLDYDVINAYDSADYDDIYTGTMANGVSDKFYIAYNLPTSVSDNNCQGDEVGFSVTFTLQQADAD
jgi:predicted ribosomally synthesized peptide with SipW-like signal peptide